MRSAVTAVTFGVMLLCACSRIGCAPAVAAASSAQIDDELPKCQEGLLLPVWQPQDHLTLWDRVLRGTLYFVTLCFLFLGVSIGSDRFMGAIEVITSQEREVVFRKKGWADGRRVKVRVWNETVANLTLMALGSSAPEILLSIIEIVGKNFRAGDLGPGTIVGSAAFNLFVIMAVCVYVVPDGELRRIKHLGVFFVTASWSVFAYIWLYVILAVTSEGVVECWEAFLTFLFFPATVFTAYAADRKLKITRFKKYRLNRRSVIVAAEGGDVEEETQIEEEILEESCVTDPHHFALVLRDLKKRHSSATPDELEKMAVDELERRTRKSKAFYRIRANKNITGGVARTHSKREQHRCRPDEVVGQTSPGSRVYFSPDHYSVPENIGEFEVSVVREGDDLSQAVCVFYATEDGTAVAGSDYDGVCGTIAFAPGDTRKAIRLRVIDDDIFEEDEYFYVKLTKAVLMPPPNDGGGAAPVVNERPVLLGPPSTATVIILDDDHCGVFGFATPSLEVSENVGVLRLEVVRSSGARGRVTIDYVTVENTAKNEKHFAQTSGTLIFENNEARKTIDIEIVEENCYEKNVSFFVELKSPKEESNEQIFRNRMTENTAEISEEEKIAMSGKPKLGAITKIEVIIRESDEFKNTVNKLVEQKGPSVGFSSWPQQFSNAFRVKVDDDDSEGNTELTLCDYVTHFLTFIWKLFFAFVPPADMCSGYLCFVVSIIFIGFLTAVIGDLASHFGCSVGLKDSVTAVTFVALGTSVPDTFASKVAAIQDSTADNSVGNVTGSNAVNVFLGIGVAWSLAAFYHKWHNRDFQVTIGNLAFCVTLFCAEAAIAIAILLWRRSKIAGGELGGPVITKWLTSAIFLLLWIVYITMTALEAYGVIKGF